MVPPVKMALIAAASSPSVTLFAAESPAPWNPDLGDGTYQNPVLFADYSDPDAVRVGEDFYLIASSSL